MRGVGAISMATIPYSSATIESFRDEMKRYGMNMSTTTAWDVLRTVGNVGVAKDAMLLRPRPAWLEKLAGKAK
jgi:hypothetical protein